MGILSKIVTPKETDHKIHVSTELVKEELELLLKILANADLKGREVEFFYTMVLKLQNMYLTLQNKQ